MKEIYFTCDKLDRLLYDIKDYCDEIEKCIENKNAEFGIFHYVNLIKSALKELMNPKRKWTSNIINNDNIRKRNNDFIGKKPIQSKYGLLSDIECYCNNISDYGRSYSSFGYAITDEIGHIKMALKKLGGERLT